MNVSIHVQSTSSFIIIVRLLGCYGLFTSALGNDNMKPTHSNHSYTALAVDPEVFIREVEAIWQARDGAAAAAGYTEDAVVYYGRGQSHTGERLRNWPTHWFAYAQDLSITKTYRGHHGNCIAGTWESHYTHPESGQRIIERGAELFYLRGDKVYEHHMWQHSWPEDEVPDDVEFSTD